MEEEIPLTIIMPRQLFCVGERTVMHEDILQAQMDHRVHRRASHATCPNNEARRGGPNSISRRETPTEAIADTDPVGIITMQCLDGSRAAFLQIQRGVLRGEDMIQVIFFREITDRDEGVYCADSAGVRGHGVQEGDHFCLVGEADACSAEVGVLDEFVEPPEGGGLVDAVEVRHAGEFVGGVVHGGGKAVVDVRTEDEELHWVESEGGIKGFLGFTEGDAGELFCVSFGGRGWVGDWCQGGVEAAG